MPLGTKVGLGPGHIVSHGDPASPSIRGTAHNFWPVSTVAKRSPISATAEHLFICGMVCLSLVFFCYQQVYDSLTLRPEQAGQLKYLELFVLLPCNFCFSSGRSTPRTTTTTVLRPFLRDHPGEPVPEENFWTIWCKGILTQADTPTNRMGATPSRLTSAHLHHSPHISYRPDALPAAQPTASKH